MKICETSTQQKQDCLENVESEQTLSDKDVFDEDEEEKSDYKTKNTSGFYQSAKKGRGRKSTAESLATSCNSTVVANEAVDES
jgi:hypothetical protein